MRKVDSLSEINIPEKYKNYLAKYLENISGVPYVSRVILFGSCARGEAGKYSDIDIFITTNREVTEDEEIYVMGNCVPDYIVGEGVPTDIIVQSEDTFNKYINEGVDLSGLLPECAGNGESRDWFV
jgi:predicted nucleotidyltransferase